tara:strand:- start:456 stop:590 length:135 start_codon:yes stop_codon:yes gene_type:complete
MNAAVEAWNTMGYFEGLLFSLWILGMYYVKIKMDNKFSKRRGDR